MGVKLVKFEVIQFSGARVIGKSINVKEPTTIDDPTITDLLEMMKNDGHNDFLLNLPDKYTLNLDTVGWQGDFQPGDCSYTYLSGVLFKPNTQVPDGYEYRDIAPCEMAIAWIQECDEDNGGDLFADASSTLAKARAEQGYQYDCSHGFFEMEYYSEKRFKINQNNGKPVILDFYSPCQKV
ncbi:hypothetical protein [Konateibacter massiliensis]|uniref:hypothetical protein n=1 Tax=Konateibacter massiliensis TaxID=2002841 RepID=UPI000C15EEFA|nr:hypothetical protein [Konateibacter massiliensis]